MVEQKTPETPYDRQEKDTDDLKQDLMQTPSLDVFLSNNQEYFQSEPLFKVLQDLFLKCNISKVELARRAGVSTAYIHQLFAGSRIPSRDKAICICSALEADLEDTQRMLRSCGHAELYPKDKRDAVIIYGLTRRLPIHRINDDLFDNGCELLF